MQVPAATSACTCGGMAGPELGVLKRERVGDGTCVGESRPGASKATGSPVELWALREMLLPTSRHSYKLI